MRAFPDQMGYQTVPNQARYRIATCAGCGVRIMQALERGGWGPWKHITGGAFDPMACNTADMEAMAHDVGMA